MTIEKLTLEDLLISRIGTGLGLGLSNVLHPSIGYPVARIIADAISSLRGSPMARAVRANQWVIHNQAISARQLNHLVRETFRSSARSMFEFWHYFRNTQHVLDAVEFEPSFVECFRRAREGKTGTILVAPHISNFDLIGRSFVLRGLDIHVLSYPKPPSGYRFQNALRQIPGMLVTPMSIQAIRQASETLRANKVVITAVDRPLPLAGEAKYRPRFFGRPASVPVFYIRLALKHNLPITVVGACRKPDGHYRVWASDPIPMQRHPDLIQETVENAETVLTAIADVIRKAPEQWAMFYPVWPESLEQVQNARLI